MARHVKSGKHHEDRHVRDNDLEFRILMRRNRLLGLWVAEKLGLADAAAQAYAKEVVAADFDEPGDEDVVRKVMADLREKHVDTNESEIRKEMARLLGVAREQIAPGQ